MRVVAIPLALVGLCLLAAPALQAQSSSSPASTGPSIPPFVRITGTFTPANAMPPAPVETVTLAIYGDETGGAPLWQETQYVVVDADGRYAVLLGATQPDGLPLDLFASGDARWLGRRFERPGEHEQARVLLASVPYALKAADADTLGGRPSSAYLLADAGTSGGSGTTSANGTSAGTADRLTTNSVSVQPTLAAGTANVVAKFTNDTDLGNSAIYEAGGRVGVNTTAPADALHVRFTNTAGSMTGLAVQNLGGTATSYSGMLFYDQNGALAQFQGFNNTTHEYRINNIAAGASINFMTGSTSRFLVRPDGDVEIPGALRKSGVRFLHGFGTNNTFVGASAGNFTMTGAGGNSAIGFSALSSNTTGNSNTATGVFALSLTTSGNFNTGNGATALQTNTTGSSNTASGYRALFSNTTGSDNTASGSSALQFNTTGFWNTASGVSALTNNIDGSDNTATGVFALYSNTTGDNNAASGFDALRQNTAGTGNTASGSGALYSNSTGNNNVGVGNLAGFNATAGSNNIYVGANVVGVAGESNTMYLGLQGTQTKTVVAGIRGITTGVADAIPVMIDSTGQLGTVSSSRRFKEDIRDMGDASRALFSLRPVTFRYSQAYTNGAKPLQYGLVAEEVAQAFPALAVHNADGGVDTVHYETLSVLLLNELQKQQTELQTQRIEMQKQQERIDGLERLLTALLALPK